MIDYPSEERGPIWPAIGTGILILVCLLVTLSILLRTPRPSVSWPGGDPSIVGPSTAPEPRSDRLDEHKVVWVQTASNGSASATGGDKGSTQRR